MEQAILKFKEAAAAFQNEACYNNMQAARKANDEDEDLQAMLSEFNVTRKDLNGEMHKEDSDEKRVEELEARIGNLYQNIMSNANMQNYNHAKNDVEEFIVYVNAILNAAVDGDDPMQVQKPQAEHGCGGGCSSCAGCS